MPKRYIIEITARFEIDTDNIDEIQLNYDIPTLEYCESIVGEPEFLDGTFTQEEVVA
jgi:hypothetical protein